MSPLANSYVSKDRLAERESFFPLCAYVCGECLLVQLEEFESPREIFSDYAYFSSYSDSWLKHAKEFADDAAARFHLSESSQVVEVASNDGYLLQYFASKGIRVLGIDPAENVAAVAEQKGVPTLVKFFGAATARELATRGLLADLLIGNNVLAHVPDLNDFVKGLRTLLHPTGVITMEFPHLMRLIVENQFDTIYHEHFSYFSFHTVEKIFSAHGLKVYDVEKLQTHGGSLRIFACLAGHSARPETPAVTCLKKREQDTGLTELRTYLKFGERVKKCKRELLNFLIHAKQQNRTVVGYGAPAKGNTLLNYCGIRADFLDYTVDVSPHKQGLYLPGTRLPIYAPEKLRETRPDYVLVLPWNLIDEITEQHAYIKEWGGRFVIPVPRPRVC